MINSRESKKLHREGSEITDCYRINCEQYSQSHTTEYWFTIQEVGGAEVFVLWGKVKVEFSFLKNTKLTNARTTIILT